MKGLTVYEERRKNAWGGIRAILDKANVRNVQKGEHVRYATNEKSFNLWGITYVLYGIDNLLDNITRMIMRGTFDLTCEEWDKIVDIDYNEVQSYEQRKVK